MTRKKILDVSKSLFEKKGFKSVRTSEIAELAEIGEGTLFNYFKSKSELFIAALFDDLSFVQYEMDGDGLESEEQIVNEIVRIIEYYVKNAKQINKKLLREYFSIMYDAIDTDSQTTRQSQIDADQIISNNLEALIVSLVKSKKVSAHFDVQTAVKCIYGCSITIFNDFVYSDLMTYESMMEEIRNQVEFILDGKVICGKIGRSRINESPGTE
ncbi:TetR/AcrR family transcriptional regulator [Halalkalibacter sp. APA_J-10(15)]|uniref:TetR/AcrR family transcriptional regulator n=1 Tax=Halalkalibacter sp. APA_J-10(15) TaxID=2933805 RepID=UPI001FF216AC|nr:TetR/AcrR family transcriptional regulator [Halalkalibacter sp. APA_J-10(15)]